jgi:hypothetical protein
MNLYDIYLVVLLIIKLLFVFSVLQNKITPSDKIKHRIEQLDIGFKIGVSILMIYIFRPNSSITQLDNKTKIMLLTFALLNIVDFIKEHKK